MFSTFIILFREIMEISLILGIIMAATRGIPQRGRWVLIGIAGGLAGSALVALFAESIAASVDGMGQEVFNAVVLLLAMMMIGWTVVWMNKHGRAMATRMRQIGHAVSNGDLPLYALATVVSLSMWREGSEIVLFMYGILGTSREPLWTIVAGGVAGFASAAVLGLALYFGLVRIPMKYVFSVTGTLLILLASGMAAQAAGYLHQAGMLPEIIWPMWDSTWLLDEESLGGKILHSMIGYTAQPSAMQALWYAGTFLLIVSLLRWQKRAQRMPVQASLAGGTVS